MARIRRGARSFLPIARHAERSPRPAWPKSRRGARVRGRWGAHQPWIGGGGCRILVASRRWSISRPVSWRSLSGLLSLRSKRLAGLNLVLVMSHLACSDESGSRMSGSELSALQDGAGDAAAPRPPAWPQLPRAPCWAGYHFDLLAPRRRRLYGERKTRNIPRNHMERTVVAVLPPACCRSAESTRKRQRWLRSHVPARKGPPYRWPRAALPDNADGLPGAALVQRGVWRRSMACACRLSAAVR